MSGYGSVPGGGDSSLLHSIFDRAQDAIFALSSCLPCGPSSSSLKLNGRSFEIVKLLGEGGFSFVYLARDAQSGREFALKKIRCAYGSDSFREALKEVDATKRFRSPNIIRIFDSAVVQEGDGKIIYIFLPYYSKGNVQDAINAHVVRGSRFGEREMLQLFLGACKAVKCLHQYRLPNVSAQRSAPSMSMDGPPGASSSTATLKATLRSGNSSNDASDSASLSRKETREDGDNVPLIDREGGEGDEAAAYPPRPSAADSDITRDSNETVRRVALGGEGSEEGKAGELMPYAHRDIKPGNIMIADDGQTPLLYDFGSTIKARRMIKTRREAIAEQDLAAEQSSMPYRAPELFDVKTGTEITEAVDIWALGCTLFAMAYHHSPFETPQTLEQGGSLALAVLNGKYKFPDGDQYSEATRQIVRSCLATDPKARPTIDGLIDLTEKALRGVS
ncbi:Pkinase-domain-containing protein [Tilletiaria anomala UBC 951]|uniref:non-specific serine/threonine protein kinase n=1 Tax=Tilletiaria anomala (strain ATCC 24038 / CBS 436.72 / UBC 951) TaxID=1037660 RepID=A0A066VK57_TILAU|nr:Pkinase-domain-containing protein [Tilletiaria anomala UBC 951]KDN40698.1 Pkinase-domain-containing protein [Tilletiaria anomala UBC 951]